MKAYFGPLNVVYYLSPFIAHSVFVKRFFVSLMRQARQIKERKRFCRRRRRKKSYDRAWLAFYFAIGKKEKRAFCSRLSAKRKRRRIRVRKSSQTLSEEGRVSELNSQLIFQFKFESCNIFLLKVVGKKFLLLLLSREI